MKMKFFKNSIMSLSAVLLASGVSSACIEASEETGDEFSSSRCTLSARFMGDIEIFSVAVERDEKQTVHQFVRGPEGTFVELLDLEEASSSATEELPMEFLVRAGPLAGDQFTVELLRTLDDKGYTVSKFEYGRRVHELDPPFTTTGIPTVRDFVELTQTGTDLIPEFRRIVFSEEIIWDSAENFEDVPLQNGARYFCIL